MFHCAVGVWVRTACNNFKRYCTLPYCDIEVDVSVFAVSTVYADGLAPLGAGASAGKVLTNVHHG